MEIRRPSLLSAYLDGELSPKQRGEVEAALASNQNLQAELEQFRTLIGRLKGLHQVTLPEPIRNDILKQIAALPSMSADDLTEEEIELLLTAYAYGELDESGRNDVERLLLLEEPHQETVRQFQQVRELMNSLPQRTIPPEVLAVVIDRLHRMAERSTEKPRARKPFSEYLSAYLDGELSARRRAQIEQRLAESRNARQALGSLDWVRVNLSSLPKVNAPADLMKGVLAEIAAENQEQNRVASKIDPDAPKDPAVDLSWVKAENSSAPRPSRFFRWDALLLAVASVMFVVSIGGLVASFPKKGDQVIAKQTTPPKDKESGRNISPPPAVVAQGSVKDENRALAAPIGLHQLTEILQEKPDRLVHRIDRKQVTLTTHDVDKVLHVMGLTNQAEPFDASDSRRVVHFKGTARDVSGVLSRVEEMSRKDNLVSQVDIDEPHEDLRDQLLRGEYQPRTLPLRIDIVKTVRQGIDGLAKLNKGTKGDSLSKDEPVVAEERDSIKPPIVRKPAPTQLPNDVNFVARPNLNVLIVVQPSKNGK
ncbi:zf-HC2 domain-containing protein [bacterium]|nr:zf-HC2 domain-containing protein [bacterium]